MTTEHNQRVAYAAGIAARKAQASADSNPWLGEPNPRTSIRPYLCEIQGSAWARGWRDENDAIHIAKHGNPQLGDFVKRKGRRRA